MSRRIDCTLTDAQWDVLVSAVTHRCVVLESGNDYEMDEGVVEASRRRGVHNRMWDRIMGVSV